MYGRYETWEYLPKPTVNDDNEKSSCNQSVKFLNWQINMKIMWTTYASIQIP